MSVASPTNPGARARLARPILVLAIVIVVSVGIASAVGYALYGAKSSPGSGASSYCPFDVGSGIAVPTPGNTGNTSPNSTTYANGSVVFTGSASGCIPPYQFTWVFGDGSQSNLPSPVHVYAMAGYYPGSLTVDDSAGHESVSYFCINASDWPTLIAGSGYPAPACGP